MWTPSMTASASVSRFMPCGQMTCTSQPASRSVVDSCQTRRSNGTERFSTRMSALPGKTGVYLFVAARFGVGQADEIDERPVATVRERGEDVRVLAADDQGLGVLEHLFDGTGEKLPEVREPALDVLAVGAHQPGEADVGVVDLEVVAVAEQALGQLDQRRLAQVVGARLERQPEQPDLALPGARDQLERALQVFVVGREDMRKDRYRDIGAVGGIDE